MEDGKMIRGYYNFSEKDRTLPFLEKSVMFGMYCEYLDGSSGETDGEMEMTWETLDNKEVPRLKVYDDAWEILNSFKDVVSKMAKVDDENITIKEFCDILNSCGFKNLTRKA